MFALAVIRVTVGDFRVCMELKGVSEWMLKDPSMIPSDLFTAS